MQAFPDIESLRHVCEDVKRHCEYAGLATRPTIKFRGTVKLHGTNGGVRIREDGGLVAQGRNRELTIQNDNFGFAHYVSSRGYAFDALRRFFGLGNHDVTFYGEWCGQGIQKKVAVSELPKHFVVFAVYDHTDEVWVPLFDYEFNDSVKELLNEQNVWLITQAPTYSVEIDFNDPVPAAEVISQYTLQVEDECPWGKFRGIEGGLGEGIVWTSHDYPVHITFKSKGEKHKKTGTERKHVEVDPEKVASINALVDLLLPEWRLEQGFTYLRENNLPVANTSTGEYLKWLAKDILKEESDRIAANPYPWKDLQGYIMRRGKEYFAAHLDEMAGLKKAGDA